MDKRWLSLGCALALAIGACASEEGSNGGNAMAGTTGAVGGVGGTTGGAGGAGGAIGGMTGGTAGAAGTVGGMSGGAAGVMGGMTGGTAGVMGGMTGGTEMTGGVGGMTGGAGGEMTGGVGGGTMEVTDAASCIAAATADGRTGACPECGCMKCLAEVMNCQDDACQSVVSCGQAAGCSGSACYCGEGVDPLTCALYPALAGPSGPCINEIEAASGLLASGMCNTKECASLLSSLGDTDPNNAVQRARALSICTQGQRYAAATGVTPEAPEIAGMCMTECAAE